MATQSKLYVWLGTHRVWAFVLLTLSFLAFASLSLDLARVLIANAEYISSYGWQALLDGGLQQFLEICLKCALAMLCYLSFKLCEHAIVHSLVHK